jgi:hypothetical protein
MGPAFVILGAFALGSVALWIAFAKTLKAACTGAPIDEYTLRPRPIAPQASS